LATAKNPERAAEPMVRVTEMWVLRRLFLKLVLRGPTADGLTLESLPRSVPAKVMADCLFYALCGTTALFFLNRPSPYLELYLHAGTLVLVGLFFVNAAGDILADRHEAFVFSYRPVSFRAIVWAKALVMAEIGIWLGGAFNLTGLLVGSFTPGGSPFFAIAHLLSTMLNVLFCLGCVLLFHEIRIAWRFRQRWPRWLLALAVTGVFALAWTFGFDLRLADVIEQRGATSYLFPPAWFADLDNVLTNRIRNSWPLAGLAVAVPCIVLWLTLGPLTRRHVNWTMAFMGFDAVRPRTASTVLTVLVRTRVADWGLRSLAAHAAFALTTLYLTRSRDVKLRLLSALSPIFAMPVLLLMSNHGPTFLTQFWIAILGVYLGVYAFLAVQIIEASSDWRAAEIFLRVPVAGPAELCAGARRAVLAICVPPLVLFYAAVVYLATRDVFAMTLLLPGLIAIPLYAYLPNLLGRGVPFVSAPSSGEVANLLPVLGRWTFRSVPFAGLAALSYRTYYFWLLLVVELVIIIWVFRRTRGRLEGLRWRNVGDWSR
jgi:ABC-2 type transport system permease protein